MAVKELRERQQKLAADARAKLDEITNDTPAERAAEIEREYDRIMADYDALDKRAQREEDLDRRAAALEAAVNTPDPRRPRGEDREAPGAGGRPASQQDLAAERRAAFVAYLQYGHEGLTAEQRGHLVRWQDGEQRAQSAMSVTGGAYLVPEGFMGELMATLKAWGPMLDPGVTQVMNTATGASIPWPTMDDTSNTGSLIAENTQVSVAEVSFGVRTLGAYKYTSGVVLVPSELLQDSPLNVETIVRNAMAERIGRIANTHLTTGDAASKPNGIVTAAGAGYTAASATLISFDDLIELQHSLDPAYRADPSVRWMFADSTLKALRKIKDGDGNYIWQPANAQTGAPATLLQYPYAVNQAVATIASGVRSVVFGAMNRYVVRVVNQFAVRRLVERYADYDQVGFIGFARLDGNLIDSSAIKALVHP